MNTRTGALLAVFPLALLTSACLSDPVEPRVIIDPLVPVTYEAVSANDRSLPAFINADGSTQSGRQLTHASLVLKAPDSLRLILATRHVAEDGDPGAAVSDTLRAHIRVQDSTLVLARMGPYPLLLNEQASFGSDGSVVLTVEQPLQPSGGAVASYPVELLFRRCDGLRSAGLTSCCC
jgi:hypothetical protein